MGLLLQKYHKLGSLNNEHLFLTDLEAEKLKIKVWQSWSLVKTCFLACGQLPSFWPYGKRGRKGRKKRGEKKREQERHLPKALSPNTIILGIRASTQGFLRRHIYAVHNKLSEAWRIGSMELKLSL